MTELKQYMSALMKNVRLPSNKRVILTLFIAVIFSINASIIYAETLTYKASYGPLRLGTVTFEVNIDNHSEESLQTERATVQSNPLVFLIRFYGIYESKLLSDGRSEYFKGTEYSGGDTLITTYHFIHEDSIMVRTIREYSDSGLIESDTIKLQETTYDGIAAIHYVRSNIMNPGKSIIYSLYEDNYGPVIINVTDRVERIRLKSLDKDFNARFVEGEILFKGVAGWSGRYEAWISNDENAFFLRANVKIFLGSIKLELVSVD